MVFSSLNWSLAKRGIKAGTALPAPGKAVILWLRDNAGTLYADARLFASIRSIAERTVVPVKGMENACWRTLSGYPAFSLVQNLYFLKWKFCSENVCLVALLRKLQIQQKGLL